MEVSAVRRVIMHYGNGEINRWLLKCLLNGRCPLFGMFVDRGFTVLSLIVLGPTAPVPVSCSSFSTWQWLIHLPTYYNPYHYDSYNPSLPTLTDCIYGHIVGHKYLLVYLQKMLLYASQTGKQKSKGLCKRGWDAWGQGLSERSCLVAGAQG